MNDSSVASTRRDSIARGTLAFDTVPPYSTLATDLEAEETSIGVRWFGVVLGLVIANGPVVADAFDAGVQSSARSPAALNAILFFGAVYALVDTIWSRRGRVFLGDVPLFVSVMEAGFIGLLCYFDRGSESAFRVYYFLSLLITAVRHRRRVTWSTFALHAISFSGVALIGGALPSWWAIVFTIVLMAWLTWASTALARLVQGRNQKLEELNVELLENQRLLEDRIADRTRELEQSQGLLVQQEKQAAFGLLAAGIAHEVGNPLAAMSSLVQMLTRRTQDDYTGQRLAMIDEQMTRIQGTLGELVDFSRPATTKLTRIDIREACETALSIAKYYKRRKGKTVVTEYGDLPGVETVRDQLVQVLLNLVLNALDATDEGGTLTVVTARDASDDAIAIIRVRDDGSGISGENQTNIFRPYVTTKAHGTGLGLFVCRNLVEQSLGGQLLLETSSPGETVFAIRLPIDAAVSDNELANSTAG